MPPGSLGAASALPFPGPQETMKHKVFSAATSFGKAYFAVSMRSSDASLARESGVRLELNFMPLGTLY